ncbi:MAG: HEPN domain-containing protein [Colwellia sp.]
MQFNELYGKYEGLLTTLKVIIRQSHARVLREDPDEIFSDNVNFFVKSYLINICTYLEAYLQDVAFEHASRISERLKDASIPHNFLYWKLAKEVKEKELKFENANYKFNKKEISDAISGNPYKTIKAFKLIGIDLDSDDRFNEHKELIKSIVNKRNNVIHHNDDASDISFSDLLVNIDVFLEYMSSIDKLLANLNGE